MKISHIPLGEHQGDLSVIIDETSHEVKVVVEEITTGNPTGLVRKIASEFKTLGPCGMNPIPGTLGMRLEFDFKVDDAVFVQITNDFRPFAEKIKQRLTYLIGLMDRFAL